MFTFIQFRSSSPDTFFKKGVLKNFAWCGIICNRSQESCRPPGFPLKRIIRHTCFLMNFAKFLRTSFFCKTRKNTCFYQLLDFGNFQYASYKVALGVQKIEIFKKFEISEVVLVLGVNIMKKHYFSMEERNGVFPLIFTMELSFTALSYLNAHSTLNFTKIFLYF